MTKLPHNGNYAMVLAHTQEGSLRDYLKNNHPNLNLDDRITMFQDLCGSLSVIHEKNLVHCDLHSGNILVQGKCCRVTDFGLCGPVDDKSFNKVYGIIPYIAPEVLRKLNKKTKESDIYSIGMLMWELFSGYPPFDDRAHDSNLVVDICEKGLRPPILPDMPDDYARIMQRCWDGDPSKRPTIEELFDFSRVKVCKVYNGKKLNNQDDNIGSNSNNSQPRRETHPLAYHISRILDDVTGLDITLPTEGIDSNKGEH